MSFLVLRDFFGIVRGPFGVYFSCFGHDIADGDSDIGKFE